MEGDMNSLSPEEYKKKYPKRDTNAAISQIGSDVSDYSSEQYEEMQQPGAWSDKGGALLTGMAEGAADTIKYSTLGSSHLIEALTGESLYTEEQWEDSRRLAEDLSEGKGILSEDTYEYKEQLKKDHPGTVMAGEVLGALGPAATVKLPGKVWFTGSKLGANGERVARKLGKGIETPGNLPNIRVTGSSESIIDNKIKAGAGALYSGEHAISEQIEGIADEEFAALEKEKQSKRDKKEKEDFSYVLASL